MPILDRDGIGLHYEDNGAADRPVILLCNGFSATTETWNGQVAVLSDAWRVIVWDMRGHGRSDKPSDPTAYSEETTVGDMAAIRDVCGVERVVIGGLSFGGYVSLSFYRRWLARVRALMLFDTGPGFRSDAA